MSGIDEKLYSIAKAALSKNSVTALQFLWSHPQIPKQELALQLGSLTDVRGVTSRGLTLCLFEEARSLEKTQELARELLYRKLVDEFPDGWWEDEEVANTVKLASWHYDIVEFAPPHEDSATSILVHLCIESPPPTGWQPSSQEDTLLRKLFFEHWDEGDAKGQT